MCGTLCSVWNCIYVICGVLCSACTFVVRVPLCSACIYFSVVHVPLCSACSLTGARITFGTLTKLPCFLTRSKGNVFSTVALTYMLKSIFIMFKMSNTRCQIPTIDKCAAQMCYWNLKKNFPALIFNMIEKCEQRNFRLRLEHQ